MNKEELKGKAIFNGGKLNETIQDLWDNDDNTLRGRIVNCKVVASEQGSSVHYEYLVEWKGGDGVNEGDWIMEETLKSQFPADVAEYKQCWDDQWQLQKKREKSRGYAIPQERHRGNDDGEKKAKRTGTPRVGHDVGGSDVGAAQLNAGRGKSSGSNRRRSTGSFERNSSSNSAVPDKPHQTYKGPPLPPTFSEKEQVTVKYFYKMVALNSGVQREMENIVQEKALLAERWKVIMEEAAVSSHFGSDFDMLEDLQMELLEQNTDSEALDLQLAKLEGLRTKLKKVRNKPPQEPPKGNEEERKALRDMEHPLNGQRENDGRSDELDSADNRDNTVRGGGGGGSGGECEETCEGGGSSSSKEDKERYLYGLAVQVAKQREYLKNVQVNVARLQALDRASAFHVA